MKLRTLATVCSCIGAALVVIAVCLTYFVVPNLPATATWSEEEAIAYQKASTTYHNATFDRTLTGEERQKSADDWQHHRDKLDSAIEKRSVWPSRLRYAGFAFVLMGVSFYVAAKVRNEKDDE